MAIERVALAERYRFGGLDSLSGTASNMLMRQYQFPLDYDDTVDTLVMEDHDRILYRDPTRGQACIEQHTGSFEGDIGYWAKDSTPEKILAFLVDFLLARGKTQWTGFRITASLNGRNGSIVWSLQLFAKGEKSQTAVYDGEDAPNVLGSSHGFQAHGR